MAVEVEAHNLVSGDAEAAREGLGVLRLEGMALPVVEGDGGDAARAVAAHGEREAGRAVLSAAQHDDGLDGFFFHAGRSITQFPPRRECAILTPWKKMPS